MPHIAVTGGSGRAGHAVIKELLKHGYDVTNIDIRPPTKPEAPYLQVNISDYGAAFAALHNVDGIIHMGANPSPTQHHLIGQQRFDNNLHAGYNIMNIAATLNIPRVVWASSIMALGETPQYVPSDEHHPCTPTYPYSLCKLLEEEMARQFARWSSTTYIGLRLSYVMPPGDYKYLPDSLWKNPADASPYLWAYVDARDVAQMCRLALESDVSGAEVFNASAADTLQPQPSEELMAEFFPDVPIRHPIATYETLFSYNKARRMLGYEPQHSWRDHLEAPG